MACIIPEIKVAWRPPRPYRETCRPSFIHISDGKLHDMNVLDLLLPEPGAIYVMDRGYVDFARLHVLHQAGASH